MREGGRDLDTSVAHVFWNKLQAFYKTDIYVEKTMKISSLHYQAQSQIRK